MPIHTDEDIKFYLDPFEFLNKPRRVFMGLDMLVDNDVDHPDEAKELVRRIIKETREVFLDKVLPKFEKDII